MSAEQRRNPSQPPPLPTGERRVPPEANRKTVFSELEESIRETVKKEAEQKKKDAYLKESQELFSLDPLVAEIDDKEKEEAIRVAINLDERQKFEDELHRQTLSREYTAIQSILDTFGIKTDHQGNLDASRSNVRQLRKAEKKGHNITELLAKQKRVSAELQESGLMKFSAEDEDMFSGQLVRHGVDTTEEEYDAATLPEAQENLTANDALWKKEQRNEQATMAADKKELKAELQKGMKEYRSEEQLVTQDKRKIGAGFFGRSLRKLGLSLGLFSAATGVTNEAVNRAEQSVAAANAQYLSSQKERFDLPTTFDTSPVNIRPTINQNVTEHTFEKGEVVEVPRPFTVDDLEVGQRMPDLSDWEVVSRKVILDPETRAPIGDEEQLRDPNGTLGKQVIRRSWSPDGILIGFSISDTEKPNQARFMDENGIIRTDAPPALKAFLEQQRENFEHRQ